jgi:hypothetical protein
MRARIWVAVAVGLVALAVPASASAAVTIGEDTSTAGSGFFACDTFFPEGCTSTWFQPSHPTRSYTAPFDGVIVRWRVRGDSNTTRFSLRVLANNGDGSFTGAGTSEPEAVAPGMENSFGTRLAIKQGQYIGVDVPGNPSIPMIEARTISGGEWAGWKPRLADGETQGPDFGGQDAALVYNAEIEPDCDGDGLGDETQDPELPLNAPCGKGGQALTLDANKNKVKKRKKVTLFGGLSLVTRQGECEAGQTVQLQRKKPSQATFTTFTQVQTDATGVFSAKRKVKKTFEYRAQVPETDACLGQTSNTEKVKVKKKRKRK